MSFWADLIGTTSPSFRVGLPSAAGSAILSTALLTSGGVKSFFFPSGAGGVLALVSDLTTGYQPLDAGLTALAALTPGANTLIIGAGGGTTYDGLLIGANQYPVRLSTGALIAGNISDDATTFLGQANVTAMRSNLGAQAASADLDTLVALNAGASDVITGAVGGTFDKMVVAASQFIARKSVGVLAPWSISDFSINTLAETNAANWRTALGLLTMATQNASNVGITGGGAVWTTVSRDARGAPAAKAAASTLTGAEVFSGWANYTGAAGALTLPTGTNMDTAAGAPATHTTWDFFVVNTGSGTATLTAAAGFTIAATATIAAGRTVRFLIRRTAANTYVVCGD